VARSYRTNFGMSLLEVLVATTLLGVGVVATFECLGAISGSQQRAVDSEEMQRLTLAKYDDLIVRQTLTAGSADGDFADLGEQRFIWHAEREAAGVGNLDVLKVEVGPIGDNYRRAEKIQGLICRPASGGGS
jgi:prepilin-type N-terminal cleavage/methylation domain-containing protein